MRILTVQDFAHMWPNAPHSLAAGIVAMQEPAYKRFGINNDLRLAHLWAQFSVESKWGTEMTESLNFTPDSLLAAFPGCFTEAEAQEFGRTREHAANQVAIGDHAYGSRFGNRPGTEDGYNYRGRGLIRTRGRDAYQHLTNTTGFDLISHPGVAIVPASTLICGVSDFTSNPDILRFCDEDNLIAICSLVALGRIAESPNEVPDFETRKAATIAWRQFIWTKSNMRAPSDPHMR
jgi:putative chitinase